MALSEERKESMYKYAKNNLKRIPLDVQKDKYEEIKAAADAAGEKVNSYIKRVIDRDMYKETIYLNASIMLNQKIQEELESLLMENSDYIKSYSKESFSTGEYKLILYFVEDSPTTDTISAKFCEILKKHNIQYSHTPLKN